jgi:hypothetical protein
MKLSFEKTKMAQAVVSQVNARTGAALRAPAYSRSRSQSPTRVPTSTAAEVAKFCIESQVGRTTMAAYCASCAHKRVRKSERLRHNLVCIVSLPEHGVIGYRCAGALAANGCAWDQPCF